MAKQSRETTGKSIASFRDLAVYQQSVKLLPAIHKLAEGLPRHVQYQLAPQLRVAAKSIPANIAKGYGKKRSAKRFRACLDAAIGSANETMAHLDVGKELGYIDDGRWRELTEAYTTLAKRISVLSDNEGE